MPRNLAERLKEYLPWRWALQQLVERFSCVAIALYGYDQGMMSLVNTNTSYLRTMNISRESPLVGVIVAIYYLRCVGGAIIASFFADRCGRKLSIRLSLGITIVGGILMLIPGITSPYIDETWNGCAFWVMLVGRIVLGIGIGGVDTVIPVYSSELSEGNARGTALAKEFRANIGGLLGAFALNICFSRWLKTNSWA
ncbi:general substrate transporter [Daldinia vernicosa]|uniref:general substrate transporter n=1 Tax=Daldinia vernicosa TaxID=114800 RepID=UPI0020078769|nr:general substrate transporter [Daldinia vernicosa]KAI0850823.1 general substrate transporter [Daldinia vernicosa]